MNKGEESKSVMAFIFSCCCCCFFQKKKNQNKECRVEPLAILRMNEMGAKTKEFFTISLCLTVDFQHFLLCGETRLVCSSTVYFPPISFPLIGNEITVIGRNNLIRYRYSSYLRMITAKKDDFASMKKIYRSFAVITNVIVVVATYMYSSAAASSTFNIIWTPAME